MLPDLQQDMVWDGWIAAEIRATYFGALVSTFQNRQRLLVVAGLLLSLGATFTLLTSVVPPQLAWIKPMLTVLAAAMSLWSLVAKNERSAIGAADLHSRWSTLALGYETLWADMYGDIATQTLERLRKDEIEISKSSTTMPAYKRMLVSAQENVVMHHRHHLPA